MDYVRNTKELIPTYCNTPGNEEADKMAKKWCTDIKYDEAVICVRSSYTGNWESQHPDYQKGNAYCTFCQSEQLALFC